MGLHKLTPRQYQILGLASRGYSNGRIANELEIAPASVSASLGESYARMDIPDGEQSTQRLIASLVFWGVVQITATGTVAFMRPPAVNTR